MRTEGDEGSRTQHYMQSVSLLRAIGESDSLDQWETDELYELLKFLNEFDRYAVGRGDLAAMRLAIGKRHAIRDEIRRRDAAASAPLAEPRRIVLPPRLFFEGLLRRLMSSGAYERYIKPVICDMHHEYFECVVKKDDAGARWAVIRGHLYVIPSWIWSRLFRLLARVLGKVI